MQLPKLPPQFKSRLEEAVVVGNLNQEDVFRRKKAIDSIIGFFSESFDAGMVGNLAEAAHLVSYDGQEQSRMLAPARILMQSGVNTSQLHLSMLI